MTCASDPFIAKLTPGPVASCNEVNAYASGPTPIAIGTPAVPSLAPIPPDTPSPNATAPAPACANPIPSNPTARACPAPPTAARHAVFPATTVISRPPSESHCT